MLFVVMDVCESTHHALMTHMLVRDAQVQCSVWSRDTAAAADDV